MWLIALCENLFDLTAGRDGSDDNTVGHFDDDMIANVREVTARISLVLGEWRDDKQPPRVDVDLIRIRQFFVNTTRKNHNKRIFALNQNIERLGFKVAFEARNHALTGLCGVGRPFAHFGELLGRIALRCQKRNLGQAKQFLVTNRIKATVHATLYKISRHLSRPLRFY